MNKNNPPQNKKRLLRTLQVLLAIFIVGDLLLWLLSDPVARFVVERGATYALGVDTTVDDLDIGLLSGRTQITALAISNPEGFDTPHFFRLSDGRVDVSLASLVTEKIVVRELSFSGIRMNLEQKGNRSNYKVILDNLGRLQAKDPPVADPRKEPSKTKEGKQFIIERLLIKDIQVEVDLLPIGGQLRRIPVKIDQIELESITSDSSGGPLIMKLTGIVIKSILTAVVHESGNLIPDSVLADLGKGLQQLEGIGRASLKITSDLQKQAGDVGQRLDKATEEMGQQLEEVGKTIGQGLGDLFKPDKKKQD